MRGYPAGADRRAALERALTAADDALSVYRTGGMAFYVEKAELLRAEILEVIEGGVP